jgi:hypothetical protein
MKAFFTLLFSAIVVAVMVCIAGCTGLKPTNIQRVTNSDSPVDDLPLWATEANAACDLDYICVTGKGRGQTLARIEAQKAMTISLQKLYHQQRPKILKGEAPFPRLEFDELIDEELSILLREAIATSEYRTKDYVYVLMKLSKNKSSQILFDEIQYHDRMMILAKDNASRVNVLRFHHHLKKREELLRVYEFFNPAGYPELYSRSHLEEMKKIIFKKPLNIFFDTKLIPFKTSLLRTLKPTFSRLNIMQTSKEKSDYLITSDYKVARLHDAKINSDRYRIVISIKAFNKHKHQVGSLERVETLWASDTREAIILSAKKFIKHINENWHQLRLN